MAGGNSVLTMPPVSGPRSTRSARAPAGVMNVRTTSLLPPPSPLVLALVPSLPLPCTAAARAASAASASANAPGSLPLPSPPPAEPLARLLSSLLLLLLLLLLAALLPPPLGPSATRHMKRMPPCWRSEPICRDMTLSSRSAANQKGVARG